MLVAIYLKAGSERVSRSFLSQRVPIYVLRDTSNLRIGRDVQSRAFAL